MLEHPRVEMGLGGDRKLGQCYLHNDVRSIGRNDFTPSKHIICFRCMKKLYQLVVHQPYLEFGTDQIVVNLVEDERTTEPTQISMNKDIHLGPVTSKDTGKPIK